MTTYRILLNTLRNQGFSFLTFEEFFTKQKGKNIVLRHDVDQLPLNSLHFAKMQADLGIRGSYYFRMVSESYDENVIVKIALMGHEVGYHYEDLSFAWAKLKAEGGRQKAEGEDIEKKLVDIGIGSFKYNLERLRKIVPVKTICMHGSPMSRWDSRLLWKYYDYRDFGIIGEPYFDINFDKVLYLTDTGRRWDGYSFNIRDKSINRKERKAIAKKTHQSLITDHRLPFPKFHSTFDIIHAAEDGRLPDKIMMTFHPQRWSDKYSPWLKEFLFQNLKNCVKYFILKIPNRM